MNLEKLKSIFKDHGCQKIYVKKLSSNDNSKNQVYLGGGFEILNIFPISEISAHEAGDWKRERFKAKFNFSWVDDTGNLFHAPNAQLILYPKYPEVRFSGFLSKCENPPSDLMTVRQPDRLLFLSETNDNKVIGFVSAHDSALTNEFNTLEDQTEHGVFTILNLLSASSNNKEELVTELKRIHDLGWIKSKRLNNQNNIVSCEASNCGGYTLEAELGIIPNGISEPDYLGWEIKQFGVNNFDKIYSKIITLMTPEPTGGDYKEKGVDYFIRTYGYEDLRGRKDRINFGGIHKVNQKHNRTNLTLKLIGFDPKSGKIRSSNGRIALLTVDEVEAATWSFSSLLKHWNKKHKQACYIPSLSRKEPQREYKYGNKIILGERTDFHFFLKQMEVGNIYYDPGIKMENASTKPKTKRRSQFRIKSGNIPNLYKTNEEVKL